MRRWCMALAIVALVGCGGDDTGDEGAVDIEDSGTTGGGTAGDTTAETTTGGDTTGEDTTTAGDTTGGSTGGAAGETTGGSTGGTTGLPGLVIAVDPLLVQFGSTTIGESRQGQFTLKNIGTEKVNITAADLTEGAEAGFSYTEEVPLGLLVPGEKRLVKMKFINATVGSHTARIHLETQPSLPSPLVIQLQAVATVPGSLVYDITPSVSVVDFGAIEVGQTSAVEFKFTNAETAPITVVGFGLGAGADAFDATIDKDTPFLLGQGSEAVVLVTYSPKNKAQHRGLIELKTESSTTPLIQVPLRGAGYTGCDGVLACRPGVATLGPVDVSEPKGATVLCENTGSGIVQVSAADVQLAAGDGFEWSVPDLPTNVAPGASFAIPIAFDPKNLIDDFSGKVLVQSDACNSKLLTVHFSGSGLETPPAPDCKAGPWTATATWEWAATDEPTAVTRVAMTPLVVNLTDDDGDADVDAADSPDVVFVAHDKILETNDDHPGRLHAIHGHDGSLIWSAETSFTWAGNLAVADLDGDQKPEIVGVALTDNGAGSKCPGVPEFLPGEFCSRYLSGRLIAIRGSDGKQMWQSDPFTGASTDLEALSSPVIADLGGDGTPEVILGAHVFRGTDGALLWAGTAGRGTDGHGYGSIAADVDDDGALEVVAGNTAYEANGSILWTASIGDSAGIAVADFDGDGTTSVLIVAANGPAVIVDGKTGVLNAGPTTVGPISCCVSSPAVADISAASPGVEVVLAGHDQVKAYDASLQLLWAVDVAEAAGGASPSVFDFDGDGFLEVVYADDVSVRILAGANGEELMKTSRTSDRGRERPVIADVDGDGTADILVGTNTGLLLLSAEGWPGARGLWAQHAYAPAQFYGNAVPVAVNPAPSTALGTNAARCKP